ncbi:Crp/Fnr family transcriptional regulator [Lutimonas sp.]|uniref:Crp/Fnr family transcriptional regulator n=1 Tax=Lutimonas sp. TaxID=1872403 RepID=UPI003D9B1927
MQPSDLRALIKPYFSDLSEKELHRLLAICEFKSYDTKSIILKAGNRSKNAFLVLEGSVRGFVTDENGEEKNILLRSKGIFVGDADALFSDAPQKLTIMSIDSTKVLMFSINSFEALAFQYEGIQRLYMSSLKEAILRLTYRVNSMITMNSEQRYLDLLEMNPDFLKGAYDKYVANYLGITAVSFSRIKKKLNKKLS